ncbi:Uncharacterized protein FWK35_00025834 [Aphis craccivora]|uniref:Uncharacterized protein n=1 Tax=Aphis craccivora TaxID=307492 RepID=A0A6G0ZGL3_APHCR|nr:Uncharacterized protein FWK35_00025834 [Aphis craccivora]
MSRVLFFVRPIVSSLRTKYVCWTAYLLRYHGKTGHVEPVPLPGAPFSHYYATDATDEGIIMETDISVKERTTFSTTEDTLEQG